MQKRFEGHYSGDIIRDIWDGMEYRKFVDSGFLGRDNPGNVTLTLNTDGVAVYRSSSTTLWPIWLMINELPPTQRCLNYINLHFPLNDPEFLTVVVSLHVHVLSLIIVIHSGFQNRI